MDVNGKTLGIVGMGRIGLALAQRAFWFYADSGHNARHHHSEAEERFNARCPYCELDTLLEEPTLFVWFCR